MLFDTSPEEPEKKKAGRRAKAVPPPAEEAPVHQKAPSILANRPSAILGKIDGHYQCLDETCLSEAFDIVDEYRGEWLVECAVCGTGLRTKAIAGYLKDRGEGFVFNDGRFAGLTVAEAAAQPRGMDYVTWASSEHPRQAVRDACKKHLDSLRAAR